MKLIVVLVICLLLSCLTLNAAAFMQYSPSCINKAMGFGYIGVADVWHQTPLMAWDNPAMPAMHEGLQPGLVRERLFDDHDRDIFPDEHFNSGMTTLSYYGFGVLIPSPNINGNAGTFYSSGPSSRLTEHRVEWTEGAMMYGFSLNPVKFLRSIKDSYPESLNNFDVSLGMDYTRANIENWLDYFHNPTHETGESNILSMGLLTRSQKQISKLILMEGSLGFKKYNLTNEQLIYNIHDRRTYSYPVGQNNIMGIGLALSIPNTGIKTAYPLKGWTENLCTLRALADRNIATDIYESFGIGLELGFIDTFYLRGGKMNILNDSDDVITWGLGVSLHDKGFWSLEYNFARMEGTKSKYPLNSWDAMIHFDGLKLIKAIKK